MRLLDDCVQDTGFFRSFGGSWDTPYGEFFLSWYSGMLLAHGERMLRVATSVFNVRRPQCCTLSNHMNSAQSIVNVGPAAFPPLGRPQVHGSPIRPAVGSCSAACDSLLAW
jgi:hypothetical protein